MMTRTCFALLVLLGSAVPLHAETFTDDFSTGINPAYWSITASSPLFTTDTTHGDVRFSKPANPSDPYNYCQIRLGLDRLLIGDFDVSVAFSNASLTAKDALVARSGGNDAGLFLKFGNQSLSVLRGSRFGTNGILYELMAAYADPPGSANNQMQTAAAGNLRIRRVGDVVSAYFNNTQLWNQSYNTDPAYAVFFLDNNYSRDAVSVTFDNFSVTADSIQPIPEPSTLALLGMGVVGLLGYVWRRRK